MKKIFKYILTTVCAWFLAHSIVITVDGLTDNISQADCILVLGNTVNPDGTLSNRLKARVDKGLELYQQQFASIIIVSGGLGKEGYYEATEMKKYLTRKGVPASHIIVDDEGINTYETADNFSKIAADRNFSSVIVVSQFFHMTRTKYILRKKGIQQIRSAHAEYFEVKDLYSMIREFAGFYRYMAY